MNVLISKDELRLLAYLHEHAKGFDERSAFKPKPVADALGITIDQLQRDSSFLAEHRFVVVRTLNMSTMNNGNNHVLDAIWITGHGENLVRKLENDLEQELSGAPDQTPGKARRLTAAAAAFVYDLSRAIVVKAVVDYATGKH